MSDSRILAGIRSSYSFGLVCTTWTLESLQLSLSESSLVWWNIVTEAVDRRARKEARASAKCGASKHMAGVGQGSCCVWPLQTLSA
eukprot:5337580-Amphidinium_carterae.2